MAYPTLGGARQIPVIGNSIARIGQVLDIVSTPCTPTPTVMVTALWHDLPKLLISLTKPDALDLVTTRAGIKHKTKPKRGFNIFDALDTSIPMPKGKIGTAIFHVGHMAERLGWYMLVADATTNFAVNWTSTVYEWSGCSIPGTPYAEGRGGPTFYLLNDHFYPALPIYQFHQDQPPFLANNSLLQSPAGYDTTLSLTVKYRSDAGAGYGVGVISSIEVWDQVSEMVVATTTPTDTGGGNMVAQAQIKSWNLINPQHQYAVRATVSVPGWFTFEGSFGSLYGHKDRGMLPDP